MQSDSVVLASHVYGRTCRGRNLIVRCCLVSDCGRPKRPDLPLEGTSGA